jgi:phosphate transport system substrate-binding protein
MQFRGKQVVAASGAVAAAIALAACSSSSSSSSSAPASAAASSPAAAASTSASASSASGTISGAGSTFQTNFQQGAISAFKSVDSGITVNYNPVGSGTGRTDLYANSVLYAGSDSPIPSKETKDVPAGKTVLYFPVQIGPIAIAYNVSGVSDLKLDATVLGEIFSGKITTWNDPAIKALNPSASLPSSSINLEVRSDSSGTTANFSQYLVDAAGSAWTLGTASTISFPKSAHANDGGSAVAAAVKATSNSIGYVDFSTATATGLTAASVKNSAGDYVAPSPASASAAAGGVTPAANLTFAAAWASGASSYPITYQSWDLVYATQPSANDAALLKAWLGYLLSPTGGQALLGNLGYAPLPSSLDQSAVSQLSQITS